MLISAPPSDEHPAVLADWLELQAFTSLQRTSRILAISDVHDISQDTEAEDVGDFDAEGDDLVTRVSAEIHRRVSALKSAYPFTINAAGTMLSVTEPHSLGQMVYLFCLLMSHVSNSPILEKADLSQEARDGRSLFQFCATIASAGLSRGPSYSFGFPRPDGSSFSEKLRQVYTRFGDGTPRDEPLIGAPPHIKDGGIDVISWTHQPDQLPSTFYMLGQVASGHNWREKTVLKDIDSFHWAWFEVCPASQVSGAMFVPFCITDAPARGGDYDEQEFLVSRMQFIAKEFGHFIYRYRLPLLAHDAERLFLDGAFTPVEGIDQLPAIERWVTDFALKLMTSPTQ